ncbi:MAG: NAD(P)-dependent oxidoreductase [Pirellulales bacterium]
MKRVLITGARGFIGRYCLEPLQRRGYQVTAATSSRDLPRGTGAEWRTADLLDPAQTAQLIEEVRPTHLLHLAWFAKPGVYWNAAENLQWLEASQSLLSCFQRCGGRRVVGAGTCAEYAESSGVYHERSTPAAPNSLYGRCKNALRHNLEGLSKATGLSAAWGRVFYLYGAEGPLEKFPQSVVASVVRGLPALCTHGRQVRDFLDVRDAADAFVALLDCQVEGTVNIGSGRGRRLAEIAMRLAERCGRPDLLRLGALPARTNEPAVIIADTMRLRDEVGWRPRIDIEQGLDELADFSLRSVAHECVV